MSRQPKTLQIGESVLVAIAQTHDLAAFQELVTLYQGRLTYYVRRLIGCAHESEDVLQEVWIVVYRRLPTLRAPEAFRVWLFKIAHDVTVSYLRRISRLPKAMSSEIEQSEPIESWDEFEAMANVELVHQALTSLDEKAQSSQRFTVRTIAAVVVCYLFGFAFNAAQRSLPNYGEVIAVVLMICCWAALITAAVAITRYWTIYRPQLEKGRIDLQVAMYQELQRQISELRNGNEA